MAPDDCHAVIVDPDCDAAPQVLRDRPFGALILWVLRQGEVAWPGTLSLVRPFDSVQLSVTLQIAAQAAIASGGVLQPRNAATAVPESESEPEFVLSAEQIAPAPDHEAQAASLVDDVIDERDVQELAHPQLFDHLRDELEHDLEADAPLASMSASMEEGAAIPSIEEEPIDLVEEPIDSMEEPIDSVAELIDPIEEPIHDAEAALVSQDEVAHISSELLEVSVDELIGETASLSEPEADTVFLDSAREADEIAGCLSADMPLPRFQALLDVVASAEADRWEPPLDTPELGRLVEVTTDERGDVNTGDRSAWEARELTLAEALAELTPTSVPPADWVDTLRSVATDPESMADGSTSALELTPDGPEPSEPWLEDSELEQADSSSAELEAGREALTSEAVAILDASDAGGSAFEDLYGLVSVEESETSTPAAVTAAHIAPETEPVVAEVVFEHTESEKIAPESVLQQAVGEGREEDRESAPERAQSAGVETVEIDSLADLASAYREQLYREREVIVQVEDLSFHLLPYQGLCVSNANPEQLERYRNRDAVGIDIDVVVTEADERLGESRSLVHFLWHLGFNAGGGRLLPWIPVDRPCRLSRWPPIEKPNAHHQLVRVAAVLSRTPTTLADVIDGAGADEGQINDFLNGCSMLGYLEILPGLSARVANRVGAPAAPPSTDVPPAPRSFVGRLRQRIGLHQ